MKHAYQYSGGQFVPDVEAAKEELRNWRLWAQDDPGHLGYPSRAAFAVQYQSGRAFDEAPREMIDAVAAERTEKIVVAIGLVNFSAHRALVSAYLHGRNAKQVARQLHIGTREAKSLLRSALALYCNHSQNMRY